MIPLCKCIRRSPKFRSSKKAEASPPVSTQPHIISTTSDSTTPPPYTSTKPTSPHNTKNFLPFSRPPNSPNNNNNNTIIIINVIININNPITITTTAIAKSKPTSMTSRGDDDLS